MAVNKMEGKIKVCCPVCAQTLGYKDVPDSGIFYTKCGRCKKIVKIDLSGECVALNRKNRLLHLT